MRLVWKIVSRKRGDMESFGEILVRKPVLRPRKKKARKSRKL